MGRSIGGTAIRGFPYWFLVRIPLLAPRLYVPVLIENRRENFCQPTPPFMVAILFVMACWLMQLAVVPIAIRASSHAHALRSWRPNLAIACGCLQIAMLVWLMVWALVG